MLASPGDHTCAAHCPAGPTGLVGATPQHSLMQLVAFASVLSTAASCKCEGHQISVQHHPAGFCLRIYLPPHLLLLGVLLSQASLD